MEITKYQFIRALRPFSFSVAFISCLTGISAAYSDGVFDLSTAILILVAGLLLQASVNLVNDYSDIHLLVKREGRQAEYAKKLIKRNFQYGLGALFIALIIGLFLIGQSTVHLIWLGVLGVIGALGYTMEPLNYKARGLGIIFVFWLMGVFMVSGSYIAMTADLTLNVIGVSLPISLLTALLLLSNELRDYQQDKNERIATLTVRIGFNNGVKLYLLLTFLTYSSAGMLWVFGILQEIWPVLLTLPLCIQPIKLLKLDCRRVALPPLTGRFFLLFGIIFCAVIVYY